jgi:ADP-dependent phosphofructokinase/glucokinase
MEHCTAEEWLVTDRVQYDRFTEFFSGSGSLAMGGQAGIAALHLASLGAPRVLCLAPALGNVAAQLLAQQGVRVPRSSSMIGERPDDIHLIFEYGPGLVPLADGTLPRNNRFIASPEKTAESTLLEERFLREVLPEVSSCTRAFLSGYQYLHEKDEFARAADQIHVLRSGNPRMRVHIECVSVPAPAVIAGIRNHILPAADSVGLNENELSLLQGRPGSASPTGQVQGMLDLAEETGLTRVHLHTFGYYLQVTRKEHAMPEISRAALLFAARTAVKTAGGTGMGISPRGIGAVHEIAEIVTPGPAPGIFSDGNFQVFVVPTLIASGITRTVGLGDIISSTAFVADTL